MLVSWLPSLALSARLRVWEKSEFPGTSNARALPLGKAVLVSEKASFPKLLSVLNCRGISLVLHPAPAQVACRPLRSFGRGTGEALRT